MVFANVPKKKRKIIILSASFLYCRVELTSSKSKEHIILADVESYSGVDVEPPSLH